MDANVEVILIKMFGNGLKIKYDASLSSNLVHLILVLVSSTRLLLCTKLNHG